MWVHPYADMSLLIVFCLFGFVFKIWYVLLFALPRLEVKSEFYYVTKTLHFHTILFI